MQTDNVCNRICQNNLYICVYVCLGRDTGIVATCGGDTVCLIDCGTGQVMKRFKQPKEVCNCVHVLSYFASVQSTLVADYLTLFYLQSICLCANKLAVAFQWKFFG